jgi:GNAT superfamily N-acetyltransferase
VTARPTPHGEHASPVIVDADPDDIDVLSLVIADAFHPLAVSQWLIPDPHARSRVFPGYFRILTEHAIDNGTVLTTPGRTAVALWLPVSTDGPQPPAHYERRLAAATGPFHARFTELDAAFGRHHPTGLLHHHLAILAVQSDQQGKGIGTALLDARHQVLDVARLPAYLEASSPETRQLYLRHGYADHGPPITFPDGPVMYPMLRHPHKVRGGDGATVGKLPGFSCTEGEPPCLAAARRLAREQRAARSRPQPLRPRVGSPGHAVSRSPGGSNRGQGVRHLALALPPGNPVTHGPPAGR